MRVSVPQPWLAGIQLRVQVVANALGLDMQGCRPGLRITVAQLEETDLVKHLPDPEHGRVRIHGPASLHGAAAEHPSGADAFVLQTFRRDKSRLVGVVREVSHASSTPIPEGESRSSSQSCYVQIGEGEHSLVAAGGCGHDLREDRIDIITLENSLLPIAVGGAGGDALILKPLFISNPGLSSTLPAQPCGLFVSSACAMPAAPLAVAETRKPQDLSTLRRSVVDFSLYRIISAKDEAPRSYTDVVSQPHLSCSVMVSDVAIPVPCLPPFQGPGPHYSGIVFFNGDNERGGGSGSSRLLQVEIVGFSEKLMRVPIPGRLHGTMPAVEVTYLGRPYGKTLPPAKGDSGGPVTQPGSASEPALLHSFVCAEVRLDPGKPHTELLYTLTPAHFVLEAVRARQVAPGSSLPQGSLRFVRPAGVALY